MNAQQAKKISLISIMDQLKTKKYKDTGRDVWYYSPFRNEKTASFKVNKWKNVFYDFGEGKGGNIIDFIMLYFQCGFTQALETIRDRFNLFSFDQQPLRKASERKKEDWRIREIKPVQHPALVNYIKKRRVFEQSQFLKEMHYDVNGKSYFGLCFENDSGGWEIRNKYAKVCLGKKDLTSIQKGSDKLCIFEGYFDYLSFLQIREVLEFDESDYLILNSVALINRVKNKLPGYKKIELYLDNDEAGNKATETLKTIWKDAKDNRLLYPNYKDLNDFVMALKNIRKRV